MGLPGSGAIGGRAAVFTVLLVGLIAYELLRHRTWRSWQVWSLLVPALACLWLDLSTPADVSAPFSIALASGAAAILCYYLFVVSEREKNHR